MDNRIDAMDYLLTSGGDAEGSCPYLDLTGYETDEQLEDLARIVAEAARQAGLVLLGDVRECLEHLREVAWSDDDYSTSQILTVPLRASSSDSR